MNKLSPNQRNFARTYGKKIAAGIEEKEAKIEAVQENYINQQEPEKAYDYAKHLLENPKVKSLVSEVLQACRTQFILMSPDAIKRLEKLAKHADSEMVRLKANQEILSRGGLDAPERVQIDHQGIFGDASVDEIRSIIKDRINQTLGLPVEEKKEDEHAEA